MSFFTLLILACVVSASLFGGSLWWYLRIRRQFEREKDEALLEFGQEGNSESKPLNPLTEEWIGVIDQQLELCRKLMNEQRMIGEDDLTLRCWNTFLCIERSLLELGQTDVGPYLERFEFVLEGLKEAQEVDGLLKQLSVSNSLLKQLNKVIQKTGDAVFEQMNVTANLNMKLDRLQRKLKEEQSLEQELADVRAELASMYELAERLRVHMDDASDEHNEDYLGVLSEFLGGAISDSFLTSMRSELDEQVEELQQLSDYRSQAINELKARLKKMRAEGEKQNQGPEYDVAFARLEKSLLESNKVIKALEHKLESLQTIKYNLNVDVRKREEALKTKDAKLKATELDATTKAQAALARERSTVDAIAGYIDRSPFSPEYSAFEEVQSEKLTKLRQLVNESELYVSVLERDLEKEKAEHEQLSARLEQKGGINLSDELSAQEIEEFENLEEVNAELEHERRNLMEQLSGAKGDDHEIVALQQKIKDIDMKIETVQANYVNMEERYLNSLMS